MEDQGLVEFAVLLRRIGNLMGEVMDISLQLSEAVDRDDPAAARMLLAQRSETIERMRRENSAMRSHLAELQDQKMAERLEKLMHGDAPNGSAEELVCSQVLSNQVKYGKLMELDKRLNMKIARDRSFYRDK